MNDKEEAWKITNPHKFLTHVHTVDTRLSFLPMHEKLIIAWVQG